MSRESGKNQLVNGPGTGRMKLQADHHKQGSKIMGLTVTVVDKPKAGVVQGTIPPELAKLLDAEVPKAMKSPQDKEIVLEADTEQAAKLYAGYAKAWGARQEPALFVRRIANRRDMADNVARLTVCLMADKPTLGRYAAGTAPESS